MALNTIRQRMKRYEEQDIESIANEDDRQIIEILERIDKEYGLSEFLKSAIQIEKWCREKYGEKEIWERNLPNSNSKDEEEKKLGMALTAIRQKMKLYEGQDIESIANEDDRQTLKILERINKDYGLSSSLKNAIQIEKWCREKYGEKEIWKRNLPNSKSKDEEKKKLGQALIRIRQRMKQYEGQDIESISNKEDRQILEILKRIDKEYNPNAQKKKRLKAQALGEVGFGSDTKLCDEINSAMNKELKKDKDNQKS